MLATTGLTLGTDAGQRDAMDAHLWERSDALRPGTQQRLVHARVQAPR